MVVVEKDDAKRCGAKWDFKKRVVHHHVQAQVRCCSPACRYFGELLVALIDDSSAQEMGIKVAMENNLCLIQGPPGTWKVSSAVSAHGTNRGNCISESSSSEQRDGGRIGHGEMS